MKPETITPTEFSKKVKPNNILFADWNKQNIIVDVHDDNGDSIRYKFNGKQLMMLAQDTHCSSSAFKEVLRLAEISKPLEEQEWHEEWLKESEKSLDIDFLDD